MAMPSHDQEERELPTASAAPSNHGDEYDPNGTAAKEGLWGHRCFPAGYSHKPYKRGGGDIECT